MATARETTTDPTAPIVVKKYANRRLYNTGSSSYVTLEELAHLLRTGADIVVYDAKSRDDITRSVLTQIILEEENKGRSLLPIGFLRRLIGFYDDSLHAFLPRYLEMSMEHFIQNQEQMRRYFGGTVGRFFPVNQLNDMTRQNMQLLHQAASMFRPFPSGGFSREMGDIPLPPTGSEQLPEGTQSEIAQLREQIAQLQEQLTQLADQKTEKE